MALFRLLSFLFSMKATDAFWAPLALVLVFSAVASAGGRGVRCAQPGPGYLPGTCQSPTLACDGEYLPNMCPGRDVQCCAKRDDGACQPPGPRPLFCSPLLPF